MRLFAFCLAALVLGLALGLGLTFIILQNGFAFDTIHAGPWASMPRASVTDSNPYARAHMAHSAFVPLSPAEGVSLMARKDSDGAWLESHCTYVVSGHVPAARLWTLTPLTPDGFPLTSRMRQTVTSAELLRDEQSAFRLALSPFARPGNQLTLPDNGRFMLMLRLYDVTASLAGNLVARPLGKGDLPSIQKEGC